MDKMKTIVPIPELGQEELTLLLHLGERLVSELDIDHVLQLVAEAARDVVQAETLVVPMIDPDGRRFTYKAASGTYAPMLLNQSFPIETGSCGWVLRHQRPLLFGDGGEDYQSPDARWKPGMASSLLVPLICRGAIIGGLSALSKEGGGIFNRRDLTVLTLFANQAGIAIDNARLFKSLEGERNRLDAILRTAGDGIHILDGEGLLIDANRAFLDMLGYDPSAIGTLHVWDWDDKEEWSEIRKRNDDLTASHGTSIFETRHRRRDGTIIDVEISASGLTVAGQAMLFAASRDITDRKLSESRLKLAAKVFTHASEGIMITDTNGVILDVNETFGKITGYGRDEVVGRTPRFLKSGRHGKDFYAALWGALNSKGHWYGELWNRRKDGSLFAEMLTIGAVRDDDGTIRNFVALFTDITQAKEHQRQLEHIAHYDMLTNLPNRVLLADRLQQGIAQSQRRNRVLAVVFLDLDGFKAVNDQHSHEAGDHLLIQIAGRMKAALREGDTLARIGGDEFVAVLTDLESPSDCEPVLDRLLEAASAPVRLAEVEVQVSGSIGVTFFPRDGNDADQLLRYADQAMYLAKQAGKNRYHLFDAAHDAALRIQQERLAGIAQALQKGEFLLYFQPKVNMASGEVIGLEALIRWNHPEKGLLAPAEFLPYVEDHPLGIELGEWVIDTALAQEEAWLSAGIDLPVSVNVGARQLQGDDFPERLAALLNRHPGVPRDHLELEILETTALEDIGKVTALIAACSRMGVSFSLDDFGTGYSSLTYLKRLKTGILKIDQTFVRDMLTDEENRIIVRGVIGMAQAFNRLVIAEGVETRRHGEALMALGCVLAQGYGIARPMPAAEIPEWVLGWRPDMAWLEQIGR